MSVARARVTGAEARYVYEAFEEMAHEYDFNALRTGIEAGCFSGRSARLPVDMSMFSYREEPASIDGVSWTLPYSDKAFREVIERTEATAICLFQEDAVSVSVSPKDEGFSINWQWPETISADFKLQLMKRTRQLDRIGTPFEIKVSLNVVLNPFLADAATGQSTPLIHVNSSRKAVQIVRKLMQLIDRDPALIGGGWSDYAGAAEFSEFRKWVTRTCQRVNYRGWFHYREDFDPFERPRSMPKGGMHYPLLELTQTRMTGKGVNAHLACVHEEKETYIEIMTGFGSDMLKCWTDSFPDLEWQVWPGDPALRWRGKSTPVRFDLSKPDPPGMFKTTLDRKIEGFLDGDTLVLAAYHSILNVNDCLKVFPIDEYLGWRSQGYTDAEREVLLKIRFIEKIWKDVERRYGTSWKKLKFWYAIYDSLAEKVPANYPNLLKRPLVPFQAGSRSLEATVVIGDRYQFGVTGA